MFDKTGAWDNELRGKEDIVLTIIGLDIRRRRPIYQEVMRQLGHLGVKIDITVSPPEAPGS